MLAVMLVSDRLFVCLFLLGSWLDIVVVVFVVVVVVSPVLGEFSSA